MKSTLTGPYKNELGLSCKSFGIKTTNNIPGYGGGLLA